MLSLLVPAEDKREAMSRSWKSDKTGKNFADEVEGLHTDPDQTDSGFLSGANIGANHLFDSRKSRGLSGTSSDREKPEDCSRKNGEEQMRADSGIVEVGLSETISQLTLKPVTVNCLKGKVQSEPTVELSPVTDPQIQNRFYQDQATLQRQEAINLWGLYYSQDDDGDTQLHIAIVQGFHEVALSLIRMAPHPALLDCLNQKRQSPLHLAVLTHQPSIARQLILAGADLSLRNSDGNTALHLAATSGDLVCARALTDPVLITERMNVIPGRRCPEIPKDLEQRNYEGETCLHSAVVAGNAEIVRLLLSVGSDLEAKERLGGRTALHLAIEGRRREVTSLLLGECRPKLDALTYAGISPYEIASCCDSQLAKELVRLGADPAINGFIENIEDLPKMPQLWQSVGLRA